MQKFHVDSQLKLALAGLRLNDIRTDMHMENPNTVGSVFG